MPRKPITQEQVNLYMSYQKSTTHSQARSAAKAGFSQRTARRIDNGKHSVKHKARTYRTRKDPFDGLFEKIVVPLLEENPALLPITLFEVMQEKEPDSIELEC